MAIAEIPALLASEEVEHGFELLYRRYAGDVLGYSRSVVHDGAQAEDIAQTTFLKAYRALRDGVQPEHPREWLIAIARNECGTHFRAASRRPDEVALDDELAAPEKGEATAAAVREALEQIGDHQRQALVLRELEGRSYDEIATALGLTKSAVETLLFRARRALREQLEAVDGCVQARKLIGATGDLTDEERSNLRGHLRACAECASLERKERGLRSVLARVASLLPLPSWFSSFFGGVAAKTAATVAVAAVATGGTVAVADHSGRHLPVRPKPTPTHRAHATLRPRVSAPTRAPVSSSRPRHAHAISHARVAPRPRRHHVVPKPVPAPPTSTPARAAQPAPPVAHPLHPTHPTHPAHPQPHVPPVAHPTHPSHPAHPQPHVTPVQSQAAPPSMSRAHGSPASPVHTPQVPAASAPKAHDHSVPPQAH